jgi:hypothetical protein
VGWLILAATSETPTPEGSADSVTVALIATLGTVLVAVIGLATQVVMKSAKDEPPVSVDPRIGERAAVLETLVKADRTIIDVIDRRLDRAEDDIERLRWEIDQLTGQRDTPPRR